MKIIVFCSVRLRYWNTSNAQTIISTVKVTYPGAMCYKGVNVVLGLVVVEQTTPGEGHGHTDTHTHTHTHTK